MPDSARFLKYTLALFTLSCLTTPAYSQTPASPPVNSDPSYQQLRNVGLSGEAVAVSNLTLHRDAGTFHLRSGTVCFLAPVAGKVTGAIFVGDGNFILEPPTHFERSSLHLLTRSDEFSEVFSQMVLRFTDSTYDEIKKAAGTGTSGGCDAQLLHDSQNVMRKKLHYNLDGRMLADVLSPVPGRVFVAFIHGKRYQDKELFVIDPNGAPPLILPVAPEEVEFLTYDDSKFGVWAAFHLSPEYAAHTARSSQQNLPLHIDHQTLETTIEKNTTLTGRATTSIVARANGVRVVPFNLFGSLRVQSVANEAGQYLSYIQEDKKDDPGFFVILPKPLSAGDKITLTTVYSGKEAISNEGGGNYYPIARMNWYPNSPNESFGEFSTYDLTFRIPKGMKIAATGALVSEKNDGDQNVSVWKSEGAFPVAGFNFGRFKSEEAKLEKPAYTIEAYANQELPADIQALQAVAEGTLPGQHAAPVALGTMSTTGMVKKAMAEGELAVQLYTDYFGPTPFHRLAMTQQTAFNYGQSWPGLIWLPITYFYDTTIRHQLGMDDPHAYFKVVAPHEVAHQWWGHTIGFSSYRDQWMSEGFADFSASLYLQAIYAKEPQQYTQFWQDERKLLLERDKEGFRAIDAGPLIMGYRMSNSRTGFTLTRRLIYPKGAFVLHMLREMMWDRRTGDQDFKAMMQDFVATYSGKAASTEDFQATVEKHMTPDMRVLGGGNMNWFFDEYVYGTALPAYQFDPSFEKNADGDVVLHIKLTQSNVNEHFRMLVPIYLELANGRIVNFGHAKMVGNTTMDERIPIKGLKDTPQRAVLNYYNDVLCADK